VGRQEFRESGGPTNPQKSIEKPIIEIKREHCPGTEVPYHRNEQMGAEIEVPVPSSDVFGHQRCHRARVIEPAREKDFEHHHEQA